MQKNSYSLTSEVPGQISRPKIKVQECDTVLLGLDYHTSGGGDK